MQLRAIEAQLFEAFYANEYRPVFGLAYALTGSVVTAQELTQDSFEEAFRRWDSLSHPEGWIRSVVVNKARSSLRRRSAERRALERLDPPPDVVLDIPADTSAFWEVVSRLPHRQAQVIALVYLEDRSIDETAWVLGCASSTVRVHLSRARTALATRLGAEE